MTTYTRFKITECGHCGRTTLDGMTGGLNFRLDTQIVPEPDAAILTRYGIPVLRVYVQHNGIWADFFEPGIHDPDRPRHYLLLAHGRKPARC